MIPINPIGSCFDAVAHNFVANMDAPNLTVCHGIMIANAPGQEGWRISHAWLEFDGKDGERVVLEPIYLTFFRANDFRENCKVERVVEYQPKEFMEIWKEKGYPGPFDPEMQKLCDRNNDSYNVAIL